MQPARTPGLSAVTAEIALGPGKRNRKLEVLGLHLVEWPGAITGAQPSKNRT